MEKPPINPHNSRHNGIITTLSRTMPTATTPPLSETFCFRRSHTFFSKTHVVEYRVFIQHPPNPLHKTGDTHYKRRPIHWTLQMFTSDFWDSEAMIDLWWYGTMQPILYPHNNVVSASPEYVLGEYSSEFLFNPARVEDTAGVQ